MNFKKSKKLTLDNPFLTARRTWNDYISSQVAQKKLWQFVALTSLMISLLCVLGIMYIGAQSKIQPYLIEVDKFGRTQYSGFLPKYAFKDIDERVVTLMLSDFIYDSRSVAFDPDVELKNINRLFSKVQNEDPAYKKLIETLKAESEANPFTRSKTETVDVKINTVLKISKTSYQVEWTEIVRERQSGGTILNQADFKSIINIKFIDTKDFNLEEIQKNPIGLYVTDYSIQQLIPKKKNEDK